VYIYTYIHTYIHTYSHTLYIGIYTPSISICMYIICPHCIHIESDQLISFCRVSRIRHIQWLNEMVCGFTSCTTTRLLSTLYFLGVAEEIGSCLGVSESQTCMANAKVT